MNIIAQIQTLLNEAGFNPGIIDGDWGPKSQTALDTAVESLRTRTEAPPAASNVIPVFMGDPVDARSEKAIQTLHVAVQPLIRELIRKALTSNITIVITSAYRSYEEQNALYEQGRSKPGEIVTHARGGHSSHNFATAADFTIFDNGKPVWESPDYATVGHLAESLGLSWGGRWNSPDEPHVYLKPDWAKDLNESQMMAGLRERHDSGADAFA